MSNSAIFGWPRSILVRPSTSLRNTITAIAGVVALTLAATTANQPLLQLFDSNNKLVYELTSSGSLNMSGSLALKNTTTYNCSSLTNAGKLTTDANGNVICSNDVSGGGGGAGGGDTGSGAATQMTFFTGVNTLSGASNTRWLNASQILNVRTFSGQTVFAKNTIASSGSLKILKDLSGATLHINNMTSLSGALTVNGGSRFKNLMTDVATSNNNVDMLKLNTFDGRPAYRVTSSGASFGSGVLTINLGQVNSGATVSPPFSAGDISRWHGASGHFFIDNVIQNDSMVNATSDWIAQNTNATNVSGFTDLGWTSPTYQTVAGAAAQDVGPNESYLFTPGYGLSLGTESYTGSLKFWVQSVNTAANTPTVPITDERMRITVSGAEIGTKTNGERLVVSGAVLIGKNIGLKNSLRFADGLDIFGAFSGSTMTVDGTTTIHGHTYTWPTTQGTNGQLLTNNGSDTLSWTTVGGGIAWNDQTSDVTMTTKNGYITDNTAIVNLTLPSTCAQGDEIAITGSGAGGFKIKQQAKQVIHFGNVNTTRGVAGAITASGASPYLRNYDSISLRCTTANLEWVILGSQGQFGIN